MSEDISWGGSLGSQLLAEISLLDAQLKNKENTSHATLVNKKPEYLPSQESKENWGTTLGSQLLAEISLLDAQFKPRELEKSETLIEKCPEYLVSSKKEGTSERTDPMEQLTSCKHEEEKCFLPAANNTCVNASLQADEENSLRSINQTLALETSVPESISIKNLPKVTKTLSPAKSCSKPSLKSYSSITAQVDTITTKSLEKRVELRRSARNKKSQILTSLSQASNLNLGASTPRSASTPTQQNSPKSHVPLTEEVPSGKLELSYWGLPNTIVKKYVEKKITQLFPWQVNCLETGNVLKGGNLIYSAPTSSGKTLVAELLMLKNILESKKKGNNRTTTNLMYIHQFYSYLISYLHSSIRRRG